MDLLVADTVTLAATKGIDVAKFLLPSCYSNAHMSITDSYALSSSFLSSITGILQISAVILPVDAVAPPPVKSNTYRIPRRTVLRRKRRTKRKLSGDDDSGEAGQEQYFFGNGGDGAFGGGFGGSGGGGGWNFNRFGERHDWDDSSSSYSDPAFDFVYQVLSWIVLSNCLHFAFKKIVRIVGNGIVGADRGKVVPED